MQRVLTAVTVLLTGAGACDAAAVAGDGEVLFAWLPRVQDVIHDAGLPPTANGPVSLQGDAGESVSPDDVVDAVDADPSPPDTVASPEAESNPPSSTDDDSRPLGPPSTSDVQPIKAEPSDGADSWLPESMREMVRVGGALAAVLGLLGVLAFAARRLGGGLRGGNRPAGILEILARYPVGRGQQLLLLKLDRRILLLHQSGSSMTALSEMSDAGDVASLLARIEASTRESGSGRFAASLLRAGAGYRDSASGSAIETIDLTRPQGPSAARRRLLP